MTEETEETGGTGRAVTAAGGGAGGNTAFGRPMSVSAGGGVGYGAGGGGLAYAGPADSAPPPARQVPSVGRVVHYQAPGDSTGRFPPACRAATITEVGGWVRVDGAGPPDRPGPEVAAGTIRTITERWEPEACTLHVTNPTGVFLNGPIPHAEPEGDQRPRGFSWHWPERV
jgi:hypothetical protein